MRLIGITSHSQYPYWVAKAVFYTLLSLMRNYQYPDLKSRLVNTVLLASKLTKSLVLAFRIGQKLCRHLNGNNQCKNILIHLVYSFKGLDLQKDFH